LRVISTKKIRKTRIYKEAPFGKKEVDHDLEKNKKKRVRNGQQKDFSGK